MHRTVERITKYCLDNNASLFELDVMCLSVCHYALCLSYHTMCLSYHVIPALFACLLSGWATTMGRLLGPNVGNSIKYLSQGHSDALLHRELNQHLKNLKQVYEHNARLI